MSRDVVIFRNKETNNYSRESLHLCFLLFLSTTAYVTQSRVLYEAVMLMTKCSPNNSCSNSCSKEFQPFHNTNAKDTSADN